jgi:hypothetical protein
LSPVDPESIEFWDVFQRLAKMEQLGSEMRYASYDITSNQLPDFSVPSVPKLYLYHKLAQNKNDFYDIDIKGKNEFEINNALN